MSKVFNLMNPRVPGEPLQYPPKWLDGEPVPKNANAEVAPTLVVGGKSTPCNNGDIHWTSQQKGLSVLEGFSAGAPDGIDGTDVIRSRRSRGSRGGNYTYLELIYAGVLT
jgi:hypothetical protein